LPGKLRRSSPGAHGLLARILEAPDLVAAVQGLPAAALGRLIRHVGLEDAGEIVALATTGQLRRIFDDDLWHSDRPGQDETFDADRFALWLEIMLEAGEAFTAQKLCELPEDLVTLALAKQVLVIDIDRLGVAMSNRRSDDDALLEKALESCLCEEIDEYRIISRRHEGWDALLSVLLALDRDHHDLLRRILDRCCAMAEEYIEENGGLYDVLTDAEMLESDVGGDREDRRAEEGFISPSAAKSFLGLARTTALADILKAKERDPVTRAYFRSLRRPGSHEPEAAPTTANMATPAQGTLELVELLREADIMPASGFPLLEAPAAAATPADLLTRAMLELREQDPTRHGERMQELAFLANVLGAGCAFAGRSMRPVETVNACVATCSLGLEMLGGNTPEDLASLLRREGADKLFRIGWRVLHDEVVDEAARACERLLHGTRLEADARAVKRAGDALHAALTAGKPWTARQALALLEPSLDPAAMLALEALLAECPSLGGALAPADCGDEPVFIASRSQIRPIKQFLDGLARTRPPARPASKSG
jgi:hypothetical protein